MFKKNPASFIFQKLENHLPEALRPLGESIKNNGQNLVKSYSPWVSREEFEAQQLLLEEALRRIEELEKRFQQ